MKNFALTAAVLTISAFVTGAAIAAGAFVPAKTAVVSKGSIELAASRKPARRHSTAQLKGNGRVVKDTCPGGDKKCIKDLVASCDKAGGGLSTQPDGGVDCYVVGIHDQP
ncbi:MAG: hypothetical protein AB7S74_00930 [Hyphomicrobium sp.]